MTINGYARNINRVKQTEEEKRKKNKGEDVQTNISQHDDHESQTRVSCKAKPVQHEVNNKTIPKYMNCYAVHNVYNHNRCIEITSNVGCIRSKCIICMVCMLQKYASSS